MLYGIVGIINVGANSKLELKEKEDRVEDTLYTTKAARKDDDDADVGVALLNASQKIKAKTIGEEILMSAIRAPFDTILANAGLDIDMDMKEGNGIDVVSEETVNMIDAGIIDPVLVTKTALINAASVVSTIISADCVISNIRVNESS